MGFGSLAGYGTGLSSSGTGGGNMAGPWGAQQGYLNQVNQQAGNLYGTSPWDEQTNKLQDIYNTSSGAMPQPQQVGGPMGAALGGIQGNPQDQALQQMQQQASNMYGPMGAAAGGIAGGQSQQAPNLGKVGGMGRWGNLINNARSGGMARLRGGFGRGVGALAGQQFR